MLSPKDPNKASRTKKASAAAELVSALGDMLRARLSDEKTIVLYKQNKCHFQIGCAGHEAVQVAAARVFDPRLDWFLPYYRDLALCMALGMTEREVMLNALNKRDDPNSHGRQMPVHFGKASLHIPSQSSPTGAQFLQAVGCAMALRIKHEPGSVYVSSGEGACAQGDFHEAINWAAREKLPVMFLIENNHYAISVPVDDEIAGGSVAKMVAGYKNLKAYEVDGADYELSLAVMREAYKRMTSRAGPVLIEAQVPRLQSHSISDNQAKYRDEAEIARDQLRCPILKLKQALLSSGISTQEELAALEISIKKTIDEAAEWAEAQPDPEPAEALSHIYVDEVQPPEPESPPPGEELFMVDALGKALDEEMARNPLMTIFGQDVAGAKGGVFTITSGLTAKYGKERVFNAPLAESSIVGVAVGMAVMGTKPVAEIQFADYIWTAMMQIRNELALMCYRSAGDFTCPAVLRIPVGGYIHGGPYHSQNIEATFSHFPGLLIAYPSNALDAKGLLKTAIRSKNPVLFLEHKGLYRQVYAKRPDGGPDYLVPFGKARIARPGTDATVVTWGALVHKFLTAAHELEKQGVSLEIIDIRTIVPLDMATIKASVRKTNRVLVAYEDTEFMGFGAEIAAQLAESCFAFLDAPVQRLGGKFAAAVAHSPDLESYVLPQDQDVLAAIRSLLEF